MMDKQGVEVDYCPQCRGIWLDRGELEKLMERASSYYSNRDNYERDYKQYGYGDPNKPYRYDDDDHKRPYGQPNYHGHHGHHPHYKKKKTFLDEVFDIFD